MSRRWANDISDKPLALRIKSTFLLTLAGISEAGEVPDDHYRKSMKLGDLASIVQLGVGLHTGAALLQFGADLATGSTRRHVQHMETFLQKAITSNPSLQPHLDSLQDLAADLDVKATLFDREFKGLVLVNGLIALILLAGLVWISLKADRETSEGEAILLCGASTLPALLSFGWYSFRWWKYTSPIRQGLLELKRSLFPT